ncbi:MAG: class I SAM-dependent RNA methyltransferase [Oscillospiraceae bacterium]|nr:class I SAM-dependent RNA methyltransferase [Oscillospiraceae bacterium]
MSEFAVPCLFGLEGPAADELRRMGLDNVRAENGRVWFSGDGSACAKANIRLRTGERVLLLLGRFPARTFDELFEGVRALPLGDYIPRDGQFPVKGHCLDSQLHSVPDCQKIIKKAAASALGRVYGVQWLPENGALYQLQFAIVKDQAELFLDTSGAPLFKRGYRPGHMAAPLRETLAAAMVGFARYRGRDAFYDPFCGSGTLPIEAALIAHNRAPGLNRTFSAQAWEGFTPQTLWRQAAEEARSLEYPGPYHIFASDIDPKAVALSRENARRAGVAQDITFSVADALQAPVPAEKGVMVCNPPYGKRMLELDQARTLYRALGARPQAQGWKRFIISSEPTFEQFYGRPASKRRKLYNGMIQCNLYMYF